jgi:hypothetical protein
VNLGGRVGVGERAIKNADSVEAAKLWRLEKNEDRKTRT